MVADNHRAKTRREAERRLRERRENIFKFGSLEWRNIIQREYLLWPKRDRRLLDRRSLGRRQMPRRVKNGVRTNRPARSQNLSSLLTNEERDMLNELIRSDNEG